MKFDLAKASRKLSELELKIQVDNLCLDVLWFRVHMDPGNYIISRHMHSTFEFHFIQQGSVRVIHDQGEFVAGPAEFYLTAPAVYHEQHSLDTSRHVEYSLNCDLSLLDGKPSEAAQLLSILKNTPCRPYKDEFGAIKLFDRALHEACDQTTGFYGNIRSLLYMILTAAARSISGNPAAQYAAPQKQSRDEFRYRQIARFIEDNIQTPLSTRDIARYMYLSQKQVCRIIRDTAGISTKELVMSIKLRMARELLRQSGLPIAKIAEALGFSSEFYFNQFFKREEGYPPGLFRRNVQKP